MSRGRSLWIACLAVALGTAAHAQEVTLKRQLTPGRTVENGSEAEIKQTLSIAGMDVETSVTIIEDQRFRVKEKTAAGGVVCETSLAKFQFELQAPGFNLSFYSDTPNQKNDIPEIQQLIDFLYVASKAKTTITLDADGKVDKVELQAEGLDALPELYKGSLNAERMKKEAATQLGRLPSGPVKPGDTWTRSEEFDAGNGQLFTYETTYKYEGTVEEGGTTLDKITATYDKVNFSIDANSTLPLRLKSNDLKIDQSKTTQLFDRSRGEFASIESHLKITGDLVFDAGGQELPSKLNLSMKSKTALKAVKTAE